MIGAAARVAPGTEAQIMKFFEAFANIFRIPDLRKRVLFTLALLAVYRLGGHIPTPGHQHPAVERLLLAAVGHRSSASSTCSPAATSGG